jgi:hypothetical protein
MSLAKVTQVAPEEWLITGTIAGLSPANTRTAATIQRQAAAAALLTQQAPLREVWHIENVYFNGANPAPDVQIVIRVDGIDQPVTPLASSINQALLKPFVLPLTLPVPRGSVVSADLVNIAAVGVAAIVVTFRAKVMRRVVEG